MVYGFFVKEILSKIVVDEHTMIILVKTRTVDSIPTGVVYTGLEEGMIDPDWTVRVDATIIANGQSEDISAVERASIDVCNKVGEGNVLLHCMMKVLSNVAKVWIDKYHPAAPLPRHPN